MKTKGQSILEYVLILTAVVAVIIWAASNSTGPIRTVVNSTMQGADKLLNKTANNTVSDFRSY